MLTGQRGELRVGYQTAAQLGDWNLDVGNPALGQPESGLDAVVVSVDRFWSTQRPFDLWLAMDDQYWWVWTGLTVVGPVEVGRVIGVTTSTPEVRSIRN